MKFNSNKKVTFLIPIKERRNFTLRFFKYLAKVNFPYKLLIADGSKKKIPSRYLGILREAKIDFSYHKFPYDYDYILYQKKIFNSLKLIQTEYVVLFSDDDFPIIYSINKLILFLQKSKTYVACGGCAFNFDLLKKPFNKMEVYGHPINFGKMMGAKSNDKENNIKRLKCYLNEMENSWHYVFRTKVLLKNYKIIQKKKISFSNVDFYDFIQDATNFMSGKIKKIDTLTILHQYHSESAINSRLKYEQLITSKYFILDVTRFYKKILSFIFNKNKKMIKKIFFESKVLFPNNVSLLNNLTEKDNTFNLKNFIVNNLSKFTIITLFYSLYLNKIMYLNNKHINKVMNSVKNISIKNELNNIFNFLKRFN